MQITEQLPASRQCQNKKFLPAKGDAKVFTVWLKPDLISTNLQFTAQIRLLSRKHYFYLNLWMWKQRKHQK